MSGTTDWRLEERIVSQVRELNGYKALRSLEEMAREAQREPGEIIKLDGNENPYGPSPRVVEALSKSRWLHYYPDPRHIAVREALAGYVQLEPDYIAVGAGSDELIDLLLRVFLNSGDRVISCSPTFGMYRFNTEVCGGTFVDVPRDNTFAVRVDEVLNTVDDRTQIIFLASPNNPTGNLITQDDVERLLSADALIVVDEAYYEFCGHTVAPLVPHHDNLVVLRTFSKWAGLAGMRAGYGLMPPRLLEYIYRMKPPYNLNVPAQESIVESLKDVDFLRDMVRRIVTERARLFDMLGKLPYLTPIPSDANFILCRVEQGEAPSFVRALSRLGIFVRYFNSPGLENYLRISVGRPEHTDALMAAFAEVEGDVLG